MERTTRSNKTFSSWGLIPSADASFDLLDGLRTAMFEGPNDEEEELEPNSERPGPLVSPLGSPSHPGAPLSPPMSRKQRLKAASRARERAKRSDPTKGNRSLPKKILERFPEDGPSIDVDMSLGAVRVARTGFVGLNNTGKSDRVYTVQEATGEGSELGFTLQEWDGREPHLVVDKNGAICAILAGHPNDDDWPRLHEEAAAAIEAQFPCCTFPPDRLKHRRGEFPALQCGVSHGGGQLRPMNMKNEACNKKALDELNQMGCFIRIANFASSVVMRRAPRLYKYYVQNIADLQKHDPTLRRPFPCGIYSGATYNGGPQTVCYPYKDFGNLAFGMCAVTPLGRFNPTLGGHLILWECRLAIEFPAGSTILLPSAAITHSNCAVQPGETRYSFAQYTAGALFRWANNNHTTAVRFRQSLSQEEAENEDRKNERRWREGLSLLPRIDKTKVVGKALHDD